MKILIVEDLADAARVLSTLLGLVGHQTRIALDAEEALQAVEEFQPDAVMLDLGLPSMSGLELARRLRRDELTPKRLLIALTAERGPHVQAEVLQAGCDHYMAKPVNFERLCSLLAKEPPLQEFPGIPP